MSLLAQRRAFLKAYRETGSIEAAAEVLKIDPAQHTEWMKDWLYRGAFAEVQQAMKAAVPAPPPAPPKRPPGRPRTRPEKPKRPPGRPRKNPLPSASGSPDEPVDGHLADNKRTVDGQSPPEPLQNAPESPPEPPVMVEHTFPGQSRPPGSPDEPAVEAPLKGKTHSAAVCPPNEDDLKSNTRPESQPEPLQEAPKSPATPPVMVGHLYDGQKGYVRLYTPEGEVPAAPEAPRPAPEPRPEPALDITVASDEQQRALVDEYGELDRRMQLRATDTVRYEALKKAIKSWFGNVPADADGTVEGEVYLLHLSACERERKLRSIRDLVEEIGLEQVLDLAVVPIGALENLLGKTRVAGMTIETRTGSRRIKAIPKRPAIAV